MANYTEENQTENVHVEDMQEIIATPPSWLLRWGIAIILSVLVGIVAMAAFIRYPDTVPATLKINAANAPKVVVTRAAGTLVKLLAADGQAVRAGEMLAWMESTAQHEDVLELLRDLTELRTQQQHGGTAVIAIHAPDFLQLGEMQGAYQSFYQGYLAYRSAIEGGIFLQRKRYLLQEMDYAGQQLERLKAQRQLREQEQELAGNEYAMYRKLAEKRAISPMELQRQQGVYLSKQQPLQQLESSILSNEGTLVSRRKELADLENQILEEKSRFMQALNSLISEAEAWKRLHVMTAPLDGKLTYAGILQENQYKQAGEELFYVNPGSEDFFGEVGIPQQHIAKVKTGQEVLIKMQSYPFQEYGALQGTIHSITDVPVRDSVFLSQIRIERSPKDASIKLKIGMLADAQIITEDMSLMKRLWKNVRQMMNN